MPPDAAMPPATPDATYLPMISAAADFSLF